MNPITEEVIQEVTRRLVAELDPEEVILFGSYAWGTPDKYSDLDVCVIVPDGIPGFNRTQWAVNGREAIADIHADVDVMVVTRSVVEMFKTVPASLHRKIVEEGKLLYGQGKTHSCAILGQESTKRSNGGAKVSL
ncbi:MAG: nucleotidyltransferase domain-containing protein [Cyanosarcina radialis HA8281-LM2]|jgi:predicted nucleotidyltransferase|nr:nucleotidyltransferase domain-containing protein [Cyanosarcina radialis HA8281-LM2]